MVESVASNVPSLGPAFNDASNLLINALWTSGGTSRSNASRLPSLASNVLRMGRLLASAAFRRLLVDAFLCVRLFSDSSLKEISASV